MTSLNPPPASTLSTSSKSTAPAEMPRAAQSAAAPEPKQTGPHDLRSLTVTVLVLRGGGGHYATYRAIEAVIQRDRPEWTVQPLFVDEIGETGDRPPTTQLSQRLNRFSDAVYDFILQNGLDWVHLLTVHIHKLLTRLKHSVDVQLLQDTWAQNPPDLVISVVPFHNRALGESLRDRPSSLPPVPVVSILTDFADSPPAYWMAPTTDNYVMCGTPHAAQQALAAGVRPERVLQTSGLVIHPDFYIPPDADRAEHRADHRERLGLAGDRMTGIVLFGANGSQVVPDIAKRLRKLGDRIQLIYICGRNSALSNALKAQIAVLDQQQSQRSLILGYTHDMPSIMRLADFFIGKPGNVSLTEAAALGLPAIVQRNWRTMPQERYAANWLTQQDIGRAVPNFRTIDTAVEQLIEPATFARYRANLERIQNRAVLDLPETLERLLQTAS